MVVPDLSTTSPIGTCPFRSSSRAITCYKDTVVLARLPKTRSGKTLRKTLSNIVNGKEYMVPSTIDDPGVIPEIIEVLRGKKLVK
jgi:propionyl-CoA synthetase